MIEPESRTKKAALAIVSNYPEAERAVLLHWAQQVLLIRASELSKTQKLKRIISVTNELGLAKPILTHIVSEIHRVGWKQKSNAMKGVIAGAGVGLVASIASPMAGVAAFGGAIAVPVILLGAGGGALLVAVVEELTKKS